MGPSEHSKLAGDLIHSIERSVSATEHITPTTAGRPDNARVLRTVKSFGATAEIRSTFDLDFLSLRQDTTSQIPRWADAYHTIRWADAYFRRMGLARCRLMTLIEFDSADILSKHIDVINNSILVSSHRDLIWARAFNLACTRGNRQMIRVLLGFLLPKGVDTGGDTYSSKATLGGNRNFLHILGDEGLAPGHDDLRTAFKSHVIEMLRNHIRGTDPLLQPDFEQRLPLHCAIVHASQDKSSVGLCKSLIDWTDPSYIHKLDRTDKTDEGLNALHYACKLALFPVVKHLIKAGVDVNVTTKDSYTPLLRACDHIDGNTELVSLLCEHGSDLGARPPDGSTPLHVAARQRNSKALRGLLPWYSSHMAMQPKDNAENTPMMLATVRGKRHDRVFSPRHRCGTWRPVPHICSIYPAMVCRFSKDSGNHVQRTSVHSLLYGKNTSRRFDFPSSLYTGTKQTWVHLPANNIEWCDELLTNWHLTGKTRDVAGLKAARGAFDLQHHAQEKSWRARFLEPGVQFCYPSPGVGHQVVFIAAPYIHFETSANVQRMAQILRSPSKFAPRRNPVKSTDGRLYATYADDSGSHPRRTLDQYLYHSMDTSERDLDQVVQRYQMQHLKSNRSDDHDKDDINRFTIMKDDVITMMVDQLWIWLIGDDLMITSFPSRWERHSNRGHGKNEPLSLHTDPHGTFEGIRDSILRDSAYDSTFPRSTSNGDLAMHAMVQCFGTFDRHARAESRLQFMSMFEQSIGAIGAREGALLKDFAIAYRELMINRRASARSASEDLEAVEKLNDLTGETELLNELKDIRDELNIIMIIFEDQQRVANTLADIQKRVIQMGSHGLFHPVNLGRYAENHREALEPLDTVINEGLQSVARLDAQAARIVDSLSELLQLKQAHSNAFLSLDAAKLSRSAAQQGQAVMVFTIVTIFFLPMSFVASFFSMNLVQLNKDSTGFSLSLASKFIFPIGIGFAIPCILLAFYASGEGMVLWNENWQSHLQRSLRMSKKNNGVQRGGTSNAIDPLSESGEDMPAIGTNVKPQRSRTQQVDPKKPGTDTQSGGEPASSSGAHLSDGTTRKDVGAAEPWVMRRLIRRRKAVTSAV